jgi:ferric-dicitrate binding protein FerR (iron transport regulator)
VSDLEKNRLFKAWTDAAARTTPELDASVRRRVLAAYAERGRPRAFPIAYRWALGGLSIAVVTAVVLFARAPAAPSFQAAHTALRDGSAVDVAPGGRIQIASDTAQSTRIEVLAGRAEFEVQKRLGRPFVASIHGV